MLIQSILVCRGAEHKAVCKGLSRVNGAVPVVVPMPIGSQAVRQFLESWPPSPRVLVTGLCGSLSPRYPIGAAVWYEQVFYEGDCRRSCSELLTDRLAARLPGRASRVAALTSDRVVHSAQTKRALAQTFAADVVDMEGFAVLEKLQSIGSEVAMLRVVSDDCLHDLPDLTKALSPEGRLLPQQMAIEMLRSPIAATRLIRGSLKGLRVLEHLIAHLFSDSIGRE